MPKGNGRERIAQQAALEALAAAPDGLTASQIAAKLWPGKARTHFAAGAVLYHMRTKGWVSTEDGVSQITTMGADRLADLLEQNPPAAV